MNNYYKFTNLIEDGVTIDIYSFQSTAKLKSTLDNFFNDIDIYLKNFAKLSIYDKYQNRAKVLLEELNDIKIILNILKERDINE